MDEADSGSQNPNEMKGTEMAEDNDLLDRIHKLEVSQATQAAAATGAEATQAAAMAGAAATGAAGIAGLGASVMAGSVSLIVGIFLGMAIARAARG